MGFVDFFLQVQQSFRLVFHGLKQAGILFTWRFAHHRGIGQTVRGLDKGAFIGVDGREAGFKVGIQPVQDFIGFFIVRNSFAFIEDAASLA